jgi:hypothetical protein
MNKPTSATLTTALTGIIMKNQRALAALLLAAAFFAPSRAYAQATYTTTNGTVELVAGLTNLTATSAINNTTQTINNLITDDSWSTGILNLGNALNAATVPNNGILAGDFGGDTFFSASNSIILIGYGQTGVNWGGWTVRLLLSDDTYSGPQSFTSVDATRNTNAVTASVVDGIYQNFNGTFLSLAQVTAYQELDIAAFDTGDIGIKGIELSNMSNTFPDLSYIGVTAVPEPSTYALLALSAAGLGGYVLRRRRK